jgi:hypothetical protein
MYFQLRKLILWPRSGAAPRIVDFEPGVVNVISGASKTGKSAVIPIIDYCLGSEKCAIPVGVIRENCSWFGIVIDTVEGQKLLARREPGDRQSTGDMVLVEAAEIEVPDAIGEKTFNVDIVKRMMNRLAGLTDLDFEPTPGSSFKLRPSFRDLMAFMFQPQNIVANPDVMFFKADTSEHREKLKTIFPYVLGAITTAILRARFEIDRLQRILRRKQAELRAIESATGVWRTEAEGWVRQTIELGLLEAATEVPEDWAGVLDLLRRVSNGSAILARPSMAGIDIVLKRLEELRMQESEVALRVTEHRQRLNELRRLVESSEAYGDALRIQRDRLSISTWLRSLASDANDPLVRLGNGGLDKIAMLCDALGGLEMRLRTKPVLSNTLDKEILRQRGNAEVTLADLNGIRREIAELEQDSDVAKESMHRFDQIERFLGRLEQALQLYDRADQSADLRQEVEKLQVEVAARQATIAEAEIQRRLRSALTRIGHLASRVVPQMDAEWPDAPIRLVIEDLTIKVVRGAREDYLWEIGSGANWLAYHIALMLGLQQFFLSEPHHPVPGLLIFDQPSQVYFPKRAAGDDASEVVVWRDQDVVAVRKVFALLGSEVIAAKGRLQVIVLDHAGEEVWGGLRGVKLIEEWRGRALVPEAWIAA